jgi:hypothetical protein
VGHPTSAAGLPRWSTLYDVTVIVSGVLMTLPIDAVIATSLTACAPLQVVAPAVRVTIVPQLALTLPL